MGSSWDPPPKQVFPYSIGGPPIIPIRTCLGGGGRGFYNQTPPLGRFDASTGMMILASLRCEVVSTPGGVGRIDATSHAGVVNTTGAAEKFDATTQRDATRSLMQQPRTTYWQASVPSSHVGSEHHPCNNQAW